MRISDWSSDVCSSDLDRGLGVRRATLDRREKARRKGFLPRREPRENLRFRGQVRVDRAGLDGLGGNSGRLRCGFGGPRSRIDPETGFGDAFEQRSEEHTSELQSLMRLSYAVFCLNKQHNHKHLYN